MNERLDWPPTNQCLFPCLIHFFPTTIRVLNNPSQPRAVHGRNIFVSGQLPRFKVSWFPRWRIDLSSPSTLSTLSAWLNGRGEVCGSSGVCGKKKEGGWNWEFGGQWPIHKVYFAIYTLQNEDTCPYKENC